MILNLISENKHNFIKVLIHHFYTIAKTLESSLFINSYIHITFPPNIGVATKVHVPPKQIETLNFFIANQIILEFYFVACCAFRKKSSFWSICLQLPSVLEFEHNEAVANTLGAPGQSRRWFFESPGMRKSLYDPFEGNRLQYFHFRSSFSRKNK